ncbi:hypothetical protein NDN08_006154 [Rhodosorus marinus]|uniref:SWIM-type domain-containing protein n=1 Tax=Rhodosorus marinus TaxID=101924 RepID=A0AAV8UKB8_9RHOD|nr:hypothetical protein NDN08_006154 [Rhodosorus marinus]
MEVGTEFLDISLAKRAVKEYCSVSVLPYFVERSDKGIFIVRCPKARDGKYCPFRIHIARKRSGAFHVKRHVKHDEYCIVEPKLNQLLTVTEARILLSKEEDVAARDLVSSIKKKYAVDTPYKTAWRALAIAKHQYAVEDGKSFQRISGYLAAVKRENPGTFAGAERTDEGEFLRAFACLAASINAIQFARPILFIDRFQIKSSFGGTLVGATTQDGTGETIPIAIGLCPIDNEANWTWFLEKIFMALPELNRGHVTVLHDRRDGLSRAIQGVLPLTHEAICCNGLENELKNISKKCIPLFWKAAKVFNPASFTEEMQRIGEISPEAYEFLVKSKPILWSTAMASVSRFGIVTGTAAESRNSWYKEFRGIGHLRILMRFVEKVGTGQVKGSARMKDELDRVTRNTMSIFKENLAKGSLLQLTSFSEDAFIVADNALSQATVGLDRVVKLNQKTCSCGEFQIMSFPCIHAATAIQFRGDDPTLYMHETYRVNYLKNVYSVKVVPIDLYTDSGPCDGMKPPKNDIRKLAKKKTSQATTTTMTAKSITCSRCGSTGHNSRTCTAN